MTEEKSAASSDNQTLADRGNNRSRQPANSAFREFIGSNWGPRPENTQGRNESAPWAAARREALGKLFPNKRLVIPALRCATMTAITASARTRLLLI